MITTGNKTGQLPKGSFVLVLFLLIGLNINCYAQVDSTQTTENLQKSNAELRAAKKEARRQKFLSKLPKNHNPKTATLLALIPGAGQIYNRRYWKLPIVYGGLGALGYFTVNSYIEYRCFRKAYLHAVDNDPLTVDVCSLAPTATESQLKVYRDNAQTSSETFLLLSILFYGLTITDAFVDAHLMKFDISDDLSVRFSPRLNYRMDTHAVIPGLGLRVHYKPKATPLYPVNF